MNKKQLRWNIAYLEDNDIMYNGLAWDDAPFSGELETYTEAGEDMIINLREVSKQGLKEYIDGFDINENVMNWWRNGEDAARANGVPFTNIKDHYQDYEDWIENLKSICEKMPY